MSKLATRLLNIFLVVLPITLILVTGCSSGEPQASGAKTTSNVSGNLESSGAEAEASGSASVPEAGTGALQSAPPATGANASAQAAAAGEGTAQPATAAPSGKPAAASGPESAAAPAGTTPAATPSPAAGNAGSASKASPEADHADGGSPSAQVSAPSIAAAQPTATAKPPSTAKPATAVQPAASVKPADNAAASTATLSIVGDKEFGIIMSATSVKLEEGDSVLDLLKRVTRANKMQMEFSGAKGFSYIEGIDNLYEFDHGAESGWMYRVNGEFPSKSAGAYTVKAGDTIDWLYTLDMGKDIGAKGP
ncbi:DUF4430 domain-containing protein [Paenibacillus sp. 19GGS1-52]|uniref:DUF4430 domain-containing protein n=1 Tax=Paenibacillus sp. 19GGS1-52 TaxID=2758563 RepID=UPI001EFB7A83|nr:DUF4430 domain-containing protein [Paenibacillus sp. 19GGS1-52]ULO06732.1 DUF4430 domain-containing protein [Paenibacillus sp. 19GGS1-52]